MKLTTILWTWSLLNVQTAVFIKAIGLSHLVVGGPRRDFGGCCTAVVVSLRILPYIEWLLVGYYLSGSSTVTVGVSCELLDMNGKVHGRWHDTSP